MGDIMDEIVPFEEHNEYQEEESTPLLAAMNSHKGESTENIINYRKSGKKLPQYLATICATLGAFALGTSLGWTSPADGPLKSGNDSVLEDVQLTPNEVSWIGSLMPMGALVIALPISVLCDLFGRKWSMLGLTVPFTIGWALIIWPNGVAMLYVGRFILGIAGGAFAVSAPLYTSEIAEKEVRGALGSYFQLMVTLGILFVYAVGSGVNLFILSIICGVVPLVFAGIFFFIPESPVYHVMKGNIEEARRSLSFFRGLPAEDVSAELDEIKENVEQARKNKVSLSQAFSTKAAKMGLFICLGLMFIQQMSGVNAVIFYTAKIFKDAGSDLDENISTIIVGVVQFLATFASTLLVDRLGRKILLLVSSSVMCICSLLLAVFFLLKDQGKSDDIGWLPLLSLCLFIVAFSIGYGPIPWMIASELFPAQTKGFVGSIGSCFNWTLAFLVTKFYSDIADGAGTDVTFWIFMAVSGLGTVFVFFILKETKGKTYEEIERDLSS